MRTRASVCLSVCPSVKYCVMTQACQLQDNVTNNTMVPKDLPIISTEIIIAHWIRSCAGGIALPCLGGNSTHVYSLRLCSLSN